MFSINDSLKYGWEKFKSNLEICLLTTLLILAAGSLVQVRGGFFLGLVAIVFSIILRIGYTKMFLKMSDGESQKFTDIFQEYRIFWKYLGAAILYMLIMMGGFILLIIPGLIWSVRFSLATIIVVDTGMRPMAALRESYAITKGKFWKLFGFFIVLALVNILGFIALGVGILVSAPVSLFACVYVYRELSKSKAGLITPSPQAA